QVERFRIERRARRRHVAPNQPDIVVALYFHDKRFAGSERDVPFLEIDELRLDVRCRLGDEDVVEDRLATGSCAVAGADGDPGACHASGEGQADAFKLSRDAATDLLLPDEKIDADVETGTVAAAGIVRAGLIEHAGLREGGWESEACQDE